MGCSEKYSIAITILLVSIVVGSFSEFIVVRHPLTNESDTVKVTCITEEVDAALIWNYDNTTGNVGMIDSFKSSHPEGANSPTTNGCEIGTLHSGSCFVEWKQDYRGWKEVNSMSFPMGPVRDYRWEGFDEWTIDNKKPYRASNRKSKEVVFSVRGSQVIKIAVCGHYVVADGPCIWILIRSKSDERSKILTCRKRVPDDSPTGGKHCDNITNGKLNPKKGRAIDEWRTFRIEWGVEGNFVRVFEDVDKEPFLQGMVETEALSYTHLKTTGDPGTRVRYHDYQYLQAESQNADISTGTYQSEKEELCFEFMVGLCSKCGLKIDLVHEPMKPYIIDTLTIFGNEASTSNGRPTWQSRSVGLSTKTSRRDKPLSLKIETIRNDDKIDKGFWAIDKVRPCQPLGTIRTSTITIRRPKTATNKYWPPIACQKLSHKGSDTIDLSAEYTRDLNTSHLGKTLKAWRESCGSSCEGFGKGSLICNSTKCGCDRGFQGKDCTKECTFGSNCSKNCGSCKERKCNKETGHCENGCESVELQPPFCQTERSTSTFGFHAVWLITLPIAALILLAVFFIIRRCSKKRNCAPLPVSYGEVMSSGQGNASMEYEEENPMYGTPNCQSSTPPLNPGNQELSSHLYAVPFVPKSGRVSMICFEEYAEEITSSGLLATQYTTFPRGLTKPCDRGRLPQNMPKNRNKNLIAYDQTRVVLDKNRDEPYSDYINASYIQGYGEPKAYIATQGPKANTVNDFWRMIWQKKVLVICMLTNVMEDGEKVCEEYWPQIGSKLKYGDITVFNIEHQVFADYTNRTFEISRQRETRKLTHLHYTGWPSRGVPMYSQSLVAYLKKLVETLGGRGPVVVHCSGGDGRTGTVILCDMCVRQGIGEGDIDVPRVAKLMCESRADMVGSPQQFLLAHIVIAESIMSISTQVPCTDVLPERIKTLRKHLPSHIQKLNKSVWQKRALHSFASSDSPVSEMSFNNKLPELIPVGLDVVNHQRYRNLIDNDDNYIGAIGVDGVREKNQNLTAQLPSSTGLSDFWRFVAEQNVELIVILQRPEPGDPMFCDLMPGESIIVPVPHIQVVTKTSYSEEGIFTANKFVITDSSQETPRSQSVTVLTCSGWGCGGNGKPPPAGDLVLLWQASENIQRKGGLSLVLCRNGVTACGLYLAMSFLLERMAVDKECDVISAVRAVRRSRPEFVQSLEQFDYLYDTALNYSRCFQTYANFP